MVDGFAVLFCGFVPEVDGGVVEDRFFVGVVDGDVNVAE